MRGRARRVHTMHLVIETKTQHGGCLKHVCEDCRKNVHHLAAIAERLAVKVSEADGAPSPLLAATHELIARLGLVREKINPGWGPRASATLGKAIDGAAPPPDAPRPPLTPAVGAESRPSPARP